jgi:hypothetical protein
MNPSRSVRLLTLVLLALIPSCSPALATPVPAKPSTTPEPTRTITTPTPEITLALKSYGFVTVPGELLFLGTFENTLERDLVDLQLALELRTAPGDLAASQLIRPVPDSLAPGEEAGLWAQFDSISGELTPSITLASTSSNPLSHSDVEVELVATRKLGSGETVILGLLTNRQIGYGRLNDLILLPTSIGRGSQGIARILLANQGLPPGQAVPFAAEVVGEVPDLGWQIYVDASPSGTPDQPPLELVTEPMLKHSEQGRAFYVFQFQNLGSLPRWLHGEAAFYRDNTLMALADLSMPVPIRPGEIRPIAISEFIGLPLEYDPTPEALREWRVELNLDALASRPSLSEVQTLRIEVLQFEVIGDLVFIRGQLANDNPGVVEHPTALLAARDIGGFLLNSAWSRPTERLAPGESVSFELTMLLPAGTTAESSEFDLQGIGTSAP